MSPRPPSTPWFVPGRSSRRVPRGLLALGLALATALVSAGAPASDPATHWAFQPLRRDLAPPQPSDPAWCRNEVDRFVLARLEARGQRPEPTADARTLIRRLSQDLVGLPPEPAAVEAFVAECAAGPTSAERAYRALVERLLASPRHGERQARPWLDIARYADTKGYVYAREERAFVHAHVYRDWVIRAFQEDLPYDRFLAFQVAADQFVPPGSPDLAALGFLTLGRRFLGVTHDIIDDRIDVVTRGALALTVQCARCHDHKYDPVPTRDYYALYGVFRSTSEALASLGPEPSDPEYRERRAKLAARMKQRRDDVSARARARAGDYLAAQLDLARYPEEGFDEILGPDDLNPALVRRWRDWLHAARARDGMHPIFAPWWALVDNGPGPLGTPAREGLAAILRQPGLNPRVIDAFATPPADLADAAARYARLFQQALAPAPSGANAPTDPALAAIRDLLAAPDGPCTVPDTGIADNDQYFTNDVREELWKLQAELDRWLVAHPEAPHVVGLVDRADAPVPRVFRRGNPGQPGEEVTRGFPAIAAGRHREPFRQGSGRRELAEAIVDPDNPLTARVAVNRLWAQLFGRGLVRTTSDFGIRADPPADRALLDWLAARFIADGWSTKAMLRRLCLSATYRQQAAPPETGPGDEGLAHARRTARRLEFEQLRDAMLAVSGELDLKGGGAPIDPFGAGPFRRTIYGFVDRQFLPATLRLFDFPHPDVHASARHETTVPQQALFLMNHGWLAGRARAFAARTRDAAIDRRITSLYRLAFQRDPTERELSAAVQFIASAEAEAAAQPPPPPPSAWTCGYGEYDEAAKRVKAFQPLPHFADDAWQGGPSYPDAKLGWVRLTPTGGHPGNDLRHACIRRWTAPRAATVRIAGDLVHDVEAGDGVRGFVVSSRHGELRAATVHHGRASMEVASVELQAGDTLDFVVHIGGGLNSDQHLWAPVVHATEGAWSAEREFPRGPDPARNHLGPWEQYAQVLLLSNEFAFLD